MQCDIEGDEFTCSVPCLLMGQVLPIIASSVDSEAVRHPVGVCVGITPFNFPAMVPLWMFPVAIVCGNTFVLKPSEKVPLSALRLGELLMESGLPEGVFNVVHGDQECVNALLTHPLVRAISFVGSTPVARHVYETGCRNGKRVQAAGGAKNHLIIMPDADVEQAVKAIQGAAYGCAGERCMAGSIAVPVGNIADHLVEVLCDSASRMKVGPTDGGMDVDMGPVLSVIRVAGLEQALALGKNCSYGNGASIFTRSGWAARQFKHHFNAGMIGINVGVPAPMAWFPFTGWNKSFFGDLHIQGTEAVQFYTRQKTTLTRWFASPQESHHDPGWEK